MKIRFANKENRKEVVKEIESIMQRKAKYLGMPSCAYQVGSITIEKDGNIEVPDTDLCIDLLYRLQDKYDCESDDVLVDDPELAAKYHVNFEKKDEENWELVPNEGDDEDDDEEVPDMVNGPEDEDREDEWGEAEEPLMEYTREKLNSADLQKVRNMITAKEDLIKKALGIDDLPIIETEEKVSFPWKVSAEDPDLQDAAVRLIKEIVERSKMQKNVSAKKSKVENEKYSMRCFLLKLGYIGDEYEKHRKVLLRNFEGSSAFKYGKPKCERDTIVDPDTYKVLKEK